MFDAVRKHRGTLIFFESPHRIQDALEDAAEVLGERHSVVAREITKKFEQVVRGRLSELAQWAKQEPKGEIVLLIEGAADEGFDYQQLATKALDLHQRGLSLKDACATISDLVGGSKKEIYDHALKLRA